MSKRRYILRKVVEAETAAEALGMDAATPVHEIFMDESKTSGGTASAIGFQHPEEPSYGFDNEPASRRRR